MINEIYSKSKIPSDKPGDVILKDCMNLKSNESCLIVADKKLENIADALYKNSLKITRNSKLILIRVPEAHGVEPPEWVAGEMLKYDVMLLTTTKSLSHTRARENASKKGARIVSMPGITIDMMKRALNVDFYKINSINKKLIKKLNNKNKIMVKTNFGTDIKFYVKGRKWIGDDGIYTKKGAFGNLPAGEIFIAPLENKTNGTIAVDASIGGIGKVDKKIRIDIKDGFIEKIVGGNIGQLLKKSLKNRYYKNVAELGIGTNYKAKITGNVLEDEKVAGTCHIAFGNNKHFGGKIDVPFHVDAVIKNPTIYADGALIMNDGKLKYK
ncbi:aminopeptidase [Candidatus Woesearchaeota archaeon]|nr:aminopeptidase [Candidatus Woesearchaeota archaeon]